MHAIISNHNKKLVGGSAPPAPTGDRTCNCRNTNDCPLQGNCLVNSLVYQATVEAQGKEPRTYVGLTALTFKERYNGHKYDLRNQKSSGTGLSQHAWELKNNSVPHTIKWKVLEKVDSYKPGSGQCNLCLAEKYHILKADPMETLNKKSELVAKCRHAHKFTLEAVT